MIEAGKFQDYDYGPHVNYAKYGSELPPEIDISKMASMKLPVLIYSFKDDELSDTQDT